MWWRTRGSEPIALPSEKGLFELAGRQPGLPLREVMVHFRELVSADMDWADSRKTRFRRASSRVRISSLVLAALSTVVLGIEAIPGRSWIALPLVATVTVLGSLEAFYNWRSRWVLMEETQYRLNRLRDEMDYYLTVTPPDELEPERLDRFFADQQVIWSDVSRRWIEFRALDAPAPGAGSS
ncbi:hypothetical protein Q0Z83_036380 [Actinoplanes sichuanensis]|uniref:DUF4231 domain-containing protein n=1 Tax=Actinoplanes sichuanensis TaxID=512349 RepID=A0ABW4ATW0_9ACTN|nr:DUF4231 domain-containing protein [Actinoplanes sichuanensis]BEL05447.1 hypothetical protein Q0Z83_036380 [Actinoplanes sichuanensis]